MHEPRVVKEHVQPSGGGRLGVSGGQWAVDDRFMVYGRVSDDGDLVVGAWAHGELVG